MDEEIERVAIIGMSGAFPGARNIGELWSLLCDGREGISSLGKDQLLAAGERSEYIEDPAYVPRGGFLEDAEYFDNEFFGVTASEALSMDPQQRLFLQHSWLALEDAGYDSARLKESVGVFAGESTTQYWFLLKEGPLSRSLEDFRLMLGNEKDFVATRTSYKLNLKGPSLDIQSACSTSLATVGLACQSLLTWGCDLALAGGVTVTAPRKKGYLAYEGMIFSPTGICRPFDAKADGTLFGEGVGVVCLKRLSEAVNDGDYIYAVIDAVAMNNDGSDKVGFTAPSIDGQADVIKLAQAMANVKSDDIGFVETHGTATPLGDPVEFQALANAFRKGTKRRNYCYLGSLKANIGHLDVAAGIASLIKTVLVLNTGIIPPLANFENPNPHIDLESSPFKINRAPVPWNTDTGKRIAGLSSFGIGGTNIHAILENHTLPVSSPGEHDMGRILLGARNAGSLEEYTRRVSDFLRAHPEVPAGRLASKLGKVRHDFPWRRGFSFRDRAEFLEELARPVHDAKEVLSGRTMFVFPGQGAQFSGMARAYYGRLPVFTEWVEKGLAVLNDMGCGNFRDYLIEGDFEAEVARTETTQPLIYIVEYALARELIATGIIPSALAGHSIGEYAAAAIAGAIGFEAGLRLVRMRGFWMQRAQPGGMIAVTLPAEEAISFARDGICVSVRNSSMNTVLSGALDAITRLEATLEEREIRYVRLKTSHAFHSPLMDDILGNFADEVRKTEFSPLRIPFFSTMSGFWLEGTPDWNEYWVSQLRQPVRFDRCVEEIGRSPGLHVVETGPGRALTGFIRSSFPERSDVFPILPNVKADVRFFEKSMAQFWEHGIDISREGNDYSGNGLIMFPGYPFALTRFWPRQAFFTPNNHTLEAETMSVRMDSPPSLSDDPGNGIRQLWKEILGHDNFDDETNFFLCGGDSFSGIQLVENLKHRIGIEIHFRDFLLFPTISGILSGGQESPDRRIVSKYIFPIQIKGESPPLFLVAGAHENRYFNPDTMKNSYEEDFFRYFSTMIAALGERQPLYGFRPKGLVLEEHIHTSVEIMASKYIEAMKQIQPSGPYYIGGECVGGIVAYEMACQLERVGDEVRQLILLDTPRPTPVVALREKLISVRHGISRTIRKMLRKFRKNGIWASVSSVLPWVPFVFSLLVPLSDNGRKRRRGLTGSLRYQTLLLGYKPLSYEGRVTYIVNERWNRKHFMMGWKRELGSRVCVFEVPGTHENRLRKSGKAIGSIIRHAMKP